MFMDWLSNNFRHKVGRSLIVIEINVILRYGEPVLTSSARYPPF